MIDEEETKITHLEDIKESQELPAIAKKRNYANENVSRKIKKFIVDPEAGSGANSYKTVQDALKKAKPGTLIKVTSGNYNESLVIDKTDITLEPKEKGGQVTFISVKDPCLTVRLRPGERCLVNNVKMLYKGSNKEEGFSEQIDMKYEKTGNQQCMREFRVDMAMPAVVMVEHGRLVMDSCTLSLDGIPREINSKVPCVVAMPGTEIEALKCSFKGDTTNDSVTAGILMWDVEEGIVR